MIWKQSNVASGLQNFEKPWLLFSFCVTCSTFFSLFGRSKVIIIYRCRQKSRDQPVACIESFWRIYNRERMLKGVRKKWDKERATCPWLITRRRGGWVNTANRECYTEDGWQSFQRAERSRIEVPSKSGRTFRLLPFIQLCCYGCGVAVDIVLNLFAVEYY